MVKLTPRKNDSVHWSINPSQKHHHSFFFAELALKSANCSSPPFQAISLLYMNPIPHILKVTKFLVKISQFKFLVMKEKNIFVYKLFVSLNISISDFSLFFM